MISIILVNWNGWADTISCAQSILNSSSGLYRVIIVDNASSDGSISAIESWSKRQLDILPQSSIIDNLSVNGADKQRIVKFGRYIESNNIFEGLDDKHEISFDQPSVIYVVDSGRNGGFGFGCNVGMRLGKILGSDAYWLLNNDCVVPPHALPAITQQVNGQPRTIFGTILKYYFRPDVIQAVGGGFLNRVTGSNKAITRLNDDTPLNFINGASFILSNQCLDEVGFFDESIFMYFEEIDYCIRAAAASYDFEVIQTEVFHKEGGSQGNIPSYNSWTHCLLNKHYVLKKHIGWGTWMIFFYASLILRSILPLGEKNARIGSRRALSQLILPARFKTYYTKNA
jgi:GT2 family glycosyltransferase